MNNPAKEIEIIRNARKAGTDSLRPPPYFGEAPPPSRLLLAVLVVAVVALLLIAISLVTELSLKYTAGAVLAALVFAAQVKLLAHYWRKR
jgi:hypothetical protein